MNKKELILDFTSLLDVMMILMFFFIRHYGEQKDVQIANLEKDLQERSTYAQAKDTEIKDHTVKIKEQEEQIKELQSSLNEKDQQIQEMQDTMDHQNGNAVALYNYKTNGTGIIMELDPQSACLVIRTGTDGATEEIGRISIEADSDDDQPNSSTFIANKAVLIADQITECLTSQGLTKDTIIIGTYLRKGDQYFPIEIVENALEIIEDRFPKLYLNNIYDVDNTNDDQEVK